jgi:hypothetical protein
VDGRRRNRRTAHQKKRDRPNEKHEQSAAAEYEGLLRVQGPVLLGQLLDRRGLRGERALERQSLHRNLIAPLLAVTGNSGDDVANAFDHLR